MAKEEKRVEILKATIKVISVMGFERAKMEDIAKEAEIGKGTIYEYFDSKSTLYGEMIRYCTLRFQEGLTEAFAEREDIFGKLYNYSRCTAAFFNEYSLLMNSTMVQQTLPQEIGDQIKRDFNSIFKLVEDEIKRAIDFQMIRPDIDSEMVATVIIGGVSQYAIRKLFDDCLAPEEIDHERLAEIFSKGLFKKEN